MMRKLRRKNMGVALWCWRSASGWEWRPGPGLAADGTKSVKQQLLDLTGGRRVKVAWNQGAENKMIAPVLRHERRRRPRPALFRQRAVADAGRPPGPGRDGGAGRRSRGHDVRHGEQASHQARQRAEQQPACSLDRSQDQARTGSTSTTAATSNESWNAPAGKIYRFPIDKPERGSCSGTVHRATSISCFRPTARGPVLNRVGRISAN